MHNPILHGYFLLNFVSFTHSKVIQMYNLALVDDHHMFRSSLKLLIASFGMKTVIEASNGMELLARLKDVHVDLIVLDLQMPVMDGYQVLKKLKADHQAIPVLVMSQFCSRESVNHALELGANGYISKNADPNDFKDTVTKVITEGYFIGSDVADYIRSEIVSRSTLNKKIRFQTANLTEKEIQVLTLAAREYNTSQIAAQLNITQRTVESHRKHILEKTKSKNFIGAILFAVSNSYISF